METNLRLPHRSCSVILGNLSNNDSDGQENVVKRHLKSNVALLQTLSRSLIPSRSARQMLAIFSGVKF